MTRVFVIAASGLMLAGCASGGGMDWFPKFEPAPVAIQFVSEPAGAEAKTSTGQACTTPCTINMPPDKEFSVVYTLAGYQAQTVELKLTQPEGVETALQPNPVEVALVAAPRTPQRRAAPAKPKPAAARPAASRPATPRPAASSPAAAAPAPAAAAPAPAGDPWPAVR